MRVAIDASPLLLRSAGVKNYLFHWLRALAETNPGHVLERFPFLPPIDELDHEGSPLSPFGTAWRVGYVVAGQRLWPKLAGIPNRGADVFHATNQVRRGVKGAALTGTIHDMTCWLMPQLHTEANVRADKRFAAEYLSKADKLIAVSENSRLDAIRLLRLKPEKVVTIWSGVEERFFQVRETETQDVRVKYTLSKPFILHVGTIEPRKNLQNLVDAYMGLPATVREQFDLVLAGPQGWGPTLRMDATKVKYLGYVSEQVLPALTKAATIFAYPSLYEGFGFPAAQAMACGVPVLTSNTSCLPEITGEGALHVDPLSVADLRAGLMRLTTESSVRVRLGLAGRARAAEFFRWERCAQATWQFWEQLR